MSQPQEHDSPLITPIPAAYIMPMWEKVVPLIRPALERYDSGFSERDVLRRLVVADMQLWVAGDYDAAVVTQILVMPQHKVCNLFAIGGIRMDGWMDEMEQAITDWSRKMGCKYLAGSGRKGWQRVTEKKGWTHLGVLRGKEI